MLLEISLTPTPRGFDIYDLILILIVLIVFVAGALVCYILFRNQRLRQQMQMEQELSDAKLRVFTNISHELRTPLTLISGPIENLLKDPSLSPSARAQLELVSTSSARMLRMVNELLDFRKLQNGHLRLKVRSVRFADVVAATCSQFTRQAADKGVTYSVINEVPDAVLWVDVDKVDIILYNLLSNALKFTTSGQSVTVYVDEQTDFVRVRVQDTGCGISLDKRSSLFKRFTSHDEINSPSTIPGTGIGMNLVKELVDLHHGYIDVESEPDKGTTFTVLLRKGSEHYDNAVDILIDDTQVAEVKPVNHPEEAGPREGEVSVLIVDDNEDMRRFLQSILSPYYQVYAAVDGKDALQKALTIIPDMVVTDLMMPVMDGLELVDHLKSEQATSHIPVVLLTAKSAIESRLEAMRYGADDYLVKPFSPEYLLARIDNLLTQRRHLQEIYRASVLQLEALPPSPKPSPDEQFLTQLTRIMDEQMENSELTVDDLVRQMALGRTVFFNKLKALTNLSPVEFIRDARVKRAAQLLLSEPFTSISEITYMVGLSDSRYFSKCFKTYYGMTPSEYRKSNLPETPNTN